MARVVVAAIGLTLSLLTSLGAQPPQERASAGQLRTAAAEVPRLVEALELRPGMTVADVGAGYGAHTIVLSRWLGPTGRVFASEVGTAQLRALREAVDREPLPNVTVVEGAAASTNLPAGCCDALFIRDVYHHLTEPADINRSLAAALKPGGRLAVIDFRPRPNSAVPDGVPADRLGHGVPVEVVEREVGAAGLAHVRTDASWSEGGQPANLYLVLFRKP
jgi:predicted methyltransferase